MLQPLCKTFILLLILFRIVFPGSACFSKTQNNFVINILFVNTVFKIYFNKKEYFLFHVDLLLETSSSVHWKPTRILWWPIKFHIESQPSLHLGRTIHYNKGKLLDAVSCFFRPEFLKKSCSHVFF